MQNDTNVQEKGRAIVLVLLVVKAVDVGFSASSWGEVVGLVVVVVVVVVVVIAKFQIVECPAWKSEWLHACQTVSVIPDHITGKQLLPFLP